MPGTSEDSFFFIPVEEVCHRPVVTCSPAHNLTDMARLMKAHNISGIVVVEDEKPVGIVSLRDLRNLIADGTNAISTLSVRDVMKFPLITIHRSDYLFKAIFIMAKQNIHRLVVVDDMDRLSGVITDTDLLRIQTRSPLYLVQEIESATTIEQLSHLGRKMTGMLQYAVKINPDTQGLIHLIAHFNDALTQRLIYILDCTHNVRLPKGAAYLVLGSEGRQEQTLRTDQDSAIAYRDDLSAEDIELVRVFARHIVSALESVGVPLCPGNMMANNPEWCHSISDWKQLVEQWISRPTTDSTVNFGVFQDMRVLHGDLSLETEMRKHIVECAKATAIFFPSMARNVVRFKPPIGMFGRFIVEKKGKDRGKLDLKKGGLFALTRGISLIALEAGIVGGTTWEKLEKLHHLHLVSDRDLETLQESFTFLIKMRLEKQLIAVSSGKEPGNYVDPLVLRDWDRDQLRAAFRGVDTLLHILKSRYQLDMMAR
ncbi:MAG: putative nucleotidyltransferase substrate binding domain-containing protein [Desulfuromonadaceae bacterium]|nr:putative nucleotidyltransferase substrate binding domain-containing protein [Desulfuromonadaceae bacterium]MDD5105798.1 putative nucleotidyltransferase substrate binding domain-containing protein [Desulfuromonadaceae bacterium]